MPTTPDARTDPTATVGPPRMTAVVRDRYGRADVLEVREVPRPVPGPGEVLVRVEAAGLDRGAWHIMAGRPLAMRLAGFGLRRPRDPGLGMELAGVVDAVGDGVTGLAVGDAVLGTGRASFAGYALARPASLAVRPAGVTAQQAAGLGVSGVTALQALRDQGRLAPGQSVLVVGASGGVGSYAVQVARVLGAGGVTGVAGPSKLDLVRDLGADDVLDHTAGPLSATGRRWDLVLDVGGNRPLSELRRLLAPAGTLVFVGGEGGGRLLGGLHRQVGAMLRSPLVRQRLGGLWVARTTTADLEVLAAMVAAGQVRTAVDRVCPPSGVRAAMADLEAGRVRGKVVVEMV